MSESLGFMKEITEELKKMNGEQIRQSVILETTQGGINKIHSDVEDIKRENIIQTKDIAENKNSLVEHMEQTKLVRELVGQNKDNIKAELHKHTVADDVRFNKLEQPRKFRKYALDLLVKVGAGAGGMYGIIRLLEYFKLI